MLNGKVKIRSDGVPLAGTRKFTPDELVRYCKNMYGNSYYRRRAIIESKKRGYEVNRQNGLKAWETQLDRYTKQQISERYKQAWERAKKLPDYQEKVTRITEHLKLPEVNEHRIATWQKKRARDELLSDNSQAHRYFIIDCDIDGEHFEEGEYIDKDSRYIEKASMMGLVAFYHQLVPETQTLARRHRQRAGSLKYDVVHWFDKRPDITFKLFVV